MSPPLLMYVHTALRNIGLYTSLSIVSSTKASTYVEASLGKWSAYLVALTFLCMAELLTLSFKADFNAQYDELKRKDGEGSHKNLEVWSNSVPIAILVAQVGIGCMLTLKFLKGA